MTGVRSQALPAGVYGQVCSHDSIYFSCQHLTASSELQ